MSGYACPTCGKNSRLPSFCCQQPMVRRGMYYCDKCKTQSNTSGDCCGSAMRQI